MHKPPVDELVADMINFLDAGLREDFEERAGIIEFDGKLSRGHAECLALLDVLRRHPEVTMCITNEVIFRSTHRSRKFFNPDVEVNHARPS